MSEYARTEASIISERLTDAQKHTALASLSEDEFRDKIVGPLYIKMGYKCLRDTCGPDEQGKDRIFTLVDPHGDLILFALQTKKGPVTMAGTKPNDNLVNIQTQLEMSLKTTVLLGNASTKVKPSQAHLCASGKVSNQARQHLFEGLEQHRIKVYGSEELIPLIDRFFPEYWLGIDADRFPYLRALRKKLCEAEDVIRIGELTGEPGLDSPVLDANYLRLRLARMVVKTVHRQHRVKLKHHKTVTKTEADYQPDFKDIAVESLSEQSHRLTLITGEGGAGKTTALRRLALTLIDKALAGGTKTVIPVVLRAKRIAAVGKTLTEAIAVETSDICQSKSPFGADEMTQGRVAVLIDAFEEVDEKARQAVLRSVLAFHEAYPKCMIVLTSRDYRSILELTQLARFVHYWILPIGLAEVDGLITRVVKKKRIEKEVVRSTLRKLNEAHGLSLSPMLVTVFLSSSDFTKQDLPPNIAEIFKKFTEQMIGRWDEKKGLHQQYEAGTKEFLVKRLAFKMHERRQRAIPIPEVRELFAKELTQLDLGVDSDAIFDEIVYRSGLFRTDGHVVEWRHHLLQEYFAGRGVPSPQFFTGVSYDEWWRTPMIFHFGDKPEAFNDLWDIVQSAESLDQPKRFDAAITIGMAVQACYLAKVAEKEKTLAWVIESFASSMDAYREAIDLRDGLGKGQMALCAMMALGRDAIGTRTLLRLPKSLSDKTGEKDALFIPVEPDRVEVWRLIGLLEAGERDAAIEGLHAFKTNNRSLIFMLHISAAWVLYSQDPTPEQEKHLVQYIADTTPVVEDMRNELLKELKSIFFRIKSGRLEAVRPEDDVTLELPSAE